MAKLESAEQEVSGEMDSKDLAKARAHSADVIREAGDAVASLQVCSLVMGGHECLRNVGTFFLSSLVISPL